MYTIERGKLPRLHETIWWMLVAAFATIFVLSMQ